MAKLTNDSNNHTHMLWCNFVLGANFIFLCFGGMVMYDNV